MTDLHHRAPGGPPDNRPAPATDDALFGKTLVREGVLTAEQLQDALQTQADMRAGGMTVRLGEVLVKTSVLTPERVKEFLHLVGKQLLYCPKCQKNFNVKNWSPDRDVFCPTCSISLVPPPSDKTIDAHGSQVLPRIGSAGETRDPAGKPFGPYRLLEELGHGGMGVVWKAWDTRLKRVVALKQILPGEKADDTTVERFVREAQLAAKLRHPSIVGVHDVGEQDGARYFTTDYIVAQPLDKLIKKGVAVRQALEWVKSAAEALAYAHEQSVVHRDIKPANLLIDAKGQIFVMDFGLAAEVDLRKESGAKRARLTMAGQVLGTPQYMSPEQAKGETDTLSPATDQFSLGVVLYELLTGRVPFRGKTVWDLLRAIGQDDPLPPTQLNRRIHRDVETICLKALEKKPEKRYETIGDFAADLGQYLGGEPISARPLTGAERMMRKVARHRAIVIPSAAAVLFGIAFGAWALAASVQKKNAISGALAQAESAEGHAKTAASDTDLERSLTEARDAFTAALALDAENRAAKSGLARVQDRLAALQASREKSIADAQNRATAEAGQRKAQEEAGELLELGRKGLDEAVRYLYDKNANYEELVKKVEVGQRLIEQAIEKAPNLALAHHLLGRCWDLRGWEDKAEACWRKAIELRPEFGPAHFELGRLLLAEAYVLTIATSESERQLFRREAETSAAEARNELVQARAGIGLDDPVILAAAEAMEALVSGAYQKAMQGLIPAIRRFEQHVGVEDLLWLLGCVVPSDVSPLPFFDRALELRPKHHLALFSRAWARSSRGDFKAAELDYTTLLDIQPRFTWALNNRGCTRYNQGKWGEALDDFNAVLKVDAAFVPALVARSAVLLDLGRNEDVVRDCTIVLERSPHNAAALCNRGAARLRNGDHAGAIEDCTAALLANPALAQASLHRGDALQAVGRIPEALKDYADALQAWPIAAKTRVSRARALRALGKWDEAIADCSEALTIDLRYAGARRERALAYLAKGDLRSAREDLAAALEADSHYLEARVDKAWVDLLLGNATEAIAECNRALQERASYGEAYLTRGLARRSLADLDGAVTDYSEAIRHNPRLVWAYANRGRALHDMGRLEDAISDYSAALAIDPKNLEARVNRGWALHQRGDSEAGSRDCTEAIAANPQYAAAYNTRAIIARDRGDLKSAISDYDAAIEIDPRFVDALNNRGWARHALGNLNGAIEDYASALSINPRFYLALYNRAVALRDLEDFEGAIRDLKAALDCAPTAWELRTQSMNMLKDLQQKSPMAK